jgi:hypothetical protein
MLGWVLFSPTIDQSSIKATTNPYSLLKLFTGFINAALML